MLFHVYILHAVKHNKIYVGFTSDRDGRLRPHNELSTKGWTIEFRPWTLIHLETKAFKYADYTSL